MFSTDKNLSFSPSSALANNAAGVFTLIVEVTQAINWTKRRRDRIHLQVLEGT